MQSICVYCGSADAARPEYKAAARALGQTLAENGITLIYGGGKTGLMGAVAEGALAAGGQAIGVIVESMNTPALAQTGLTRLEVTATIHQRKARMYELAEAFIALPGGFGTFDELFETITWAQIGLHQKPIGLLNVRDYFGPLMAAIEHARREGFIFEEHRQLLCLADTPLSLLALMKQHQPPVEAVRRWMRQ